MTSRRVLVGLLGSTVLAVGAVTAVLAPPALAATCSDSWVGPTTGVQSWATATNWSTGVPVSSSDVCITKAGTYTVDLAGSATVDSLTLGGSSGTQTLQVDGSTSSLSLTLGGATTNTVGTHGVLDLHPSVNGYVILSGAAGSVVDNAGRVQTSGGGQRAYLRSALSNRAAGKVSLAAPDNQQDFGTLTSNAGSFTVAAGATLALSGGSSFTQSGGALALAGAFTQNSGTFTAAGGAVSGHPVVLTGGTLVDSATTGGFDVQGSTTLSGDIPAGQTVTVDGAVSSVQLGLAGVTTVSGTLALTPSGNGYAIVNGSGSVTVASGGTLTTSGSGQVAYLRAPITNQSGGTVTIGAPTTQQDAGTLTTNSGTFTVTAAGGLALSNGSAFTATAGTVTVAGAFTQNSGTFTATGGALTGNPVVLTGGTLADGAATGAFLVQGSTTLSGPVPAGQTVTVDGSVTSVQLTLAGVTSVRGTVALTPSPNGYAMLTGPGSLTLGTGSRLTTSGTGQAVYLRVPITNSSGTVEIGAPGTVQDAGTLTKNSSTFTVLAGGAYGMSSGSSFTSAAGRLVTTGTFSQNGGTFTATGGRQSGVPVRLSGVTLADGATLGAFAFVGSGTLTGSVPAGQTVTVDGSSTSVQLTVPAATTVSGTLALTPSPNGYALLGGGGSLTIASGGTLTTSGGGQVVYLRIPITTDAGGTFAIATAVTNADTGTTISNSGRLSVADGAGLALSSGSTLTSTSSGTLQVAVNGQTGVASGISGPGVTLGGTLAVTTAGSSPAAGSTFTPITGPVTGTFSTFAFGPHGYTVAYPGAAVVLTATAVFTVAATPFSPHQAIATGSLQVATIGAAAAGTGTYSATVDWGDRTPPTTATVAVSGSTGTVTSAGHTYAASGAFLVTTTVANTDGTTVTASVRVIVPALKITRIGPTVGTTAGGTTVTIIGSGFTGASAVTFGTTAAASFTVVSDTRIIARTAAVPAGTVDIRVTTPGGISPVVTADRFTFGAPPTVSSVSPASGPAAGGTTVTITGSGFSGVTAVVFGTTAATSFTVVSDTQVTAVAPARAAGYVHVVLTGTYGRSTASSASDHYRFV